jgi:hypothetical protein
MPSPEQCPITIVQDLDGGLEFHATYLNDLRTGHTTIVSNPGDATVDVVFSQIISDEAACAVSLSLPPEAVASLIRALSAGLSVALQERRVHKYN